MKKLAALVVVLGATMALMAGPAAATTNPAAQVAVRCVDGRAVAVFTYSGFSPQNHLTATQMLVVNGQMAGTTHTFDGPGSSDRMSMRLMGAAPYTLTATTSVVAGGGRLKAEASARVRCGTPPPPSSGTPRAHFWGPCGDPFYRAVLDNTRASHASKFVVSYKPFGEPRRTIVQWLAPRRLVTTGLFDVAGSTRMSIRWGDRVLDSQVSAPNAVYAPCPAVAVIH